MDMKDLFTLVERFEKSGLSELTWKREGEEVTLRKGPLPAQSVPPYPPQGVIAVAPGGEGLLPVGAQAGPAAVPATRAATGTELIKAPLVGTFYRAPAPDAPPFAEKGDRVKKGQILCILEAMKLMNEFQAEFDLEVVEILAENGTMVEFGTPLFEVRRL
jgi:acetyl-CoA carboxylase biotin carboxyl carrier protein